MPKQLLINQIPESDIKRHHHRSCTQKQSEAKVINDILIPYLLSGPIGHTSPAHGHCQQNSSHQIHTRFILNQCNFKCVFSGKYMNNTKYIKYSVDTINPISQPIPIMVNESESVMPTS